MTAKTKNVLKWVGIAVFIGVAIYATRKVLNSATDRVKSGVKNAGAYVGGSLLGGFLGPLGWLFDWGGSKTVDTPITDATAVVIDAAQSAVDAVAGVGLVGINAENAE